MALEFALKMLEIVIRIVLEVASKVLRLCFDAA